MSKIIDTSEPKKQSRSHLKAPVVIIIAMVVLGLVVGLTLLAKRQAGNNLSDDASQRDSISAASDEASAIAATKSTGDALKYYDQKIEDSRGDEKVQLLLGKSTVAFNAGDFDAAMQSAVEANGIKESTATLHMIAQVYEAKGDKVKALEFYRKALEVLPKNELTARQKTGLEDKITELSGQ